MLVASQSQREGHWLRKLYDERDVHLGSMASRERLFFLDRQVSRLQELQASRRATLKTVVDMDRLLQGHRPSDNFRFGLGRKYQTLDSDKQVAERQERICNSDIDEILERHPRPGKKIRMAEAHKRANGEWEQRHFRNTAQRVQEVQRELENKANQVPVPVASLNTMRENPAVYQWHQGKTFDQSGMGTVTIRVGVDTAQQIMDRKVTKVCPHSSQYRRAGYWRGNAPLEWYTQTLIANHLGSRFTVKTIGGFSAFDAERFFTMAMEFCPHGDLSSILENHVRLKRDIPENFLWMLLAAFEENSRKMTMGDNNIPGWQQIIHRDLKLENFFLGEVDRGYFPEYVTPK